MADQLWLSTTTGHRRIGTTFKELQFQFVENVTTKFICEPLYSHHIFDEAIMVREILESKAFDIVGIKDENDILIGYAQTSRLVEGRMSQYLESIIASDLISESTPLAHLFQALSRRSYSFVLGSNGIGIVTKADLNKPISRIYLFGIISLFEMHLNFWITKFYENEIWKEKLRSARLQKAEELFRLKSDKNESLTLLECLMLCDKFMILRQSEDFLAKLEYNKASFSILMNPVETLRNEIAHSQNSIISTLDWDLITSTISRIELFLNKSEEQIEK